MLKINQIHGGERDENQIHQIQVATPSTLANLQKSAHKEAHMAE